MFSDVKYKVCRKKIRTAIFTFVLVLASSVTLLSQAITTGNSTSVVMASGTTAGSQTWSHTVTSGSNGILIVSVSIKTNAVVGSVTYNNKPLTFAIGWNESSGKVRSEMWYLKAPDTGTFNIVVTMGSYYFANFVAGATNFFGVDQTTPYGSLTTAEGSGNPSITVASAIGELVIDAVAAFNVDTESSGAGQTILWTNKNGTASNDAWAGSSKKEGASSVTMSWTKTGTGAGSWACVALSLKPGVTDNELPVITCAADQTQTAAPGLCTAAVTVTGPATSDNSGVATVVNGYNGTADASGTYPVGTTPILWTVTDLSGNTAICIQNITITDDELPVITCPGYLTAICDISEQPVYADYAAFTAAGGSAADNCNIDAASFILLSEASDGLSCPEKITRTYQISDVNGNSQTCTQDIVIDDISNPTASNPAPVNVECIGDVPAWDITVVTDEADNCGVPTVAFVSDVSDGNTCPEVITRTYSVTDACLNQILVTQTITVDDNITPTASNPAPVSVSCIGDVPAWDITVVTDEADNCTAEPVVAFVSDVSDGLNCPETITRTYSVTDDCGNSINVAQTITIDDNIAPVFDANPGNLTAQCDISEQPAYANYVAFVASGGSATDNCGINPASFLLVSEISDGLSCPETVTRTYRIADLCGNTVDYVQTITLDDNIDPTFDANPGNLTAVCDISEQPAYANYVTFVAAGGSATDNCGINPASFLLVSEISDGLIGPETITRTYRIADLCGNTVSYSQKIVISENVDPVIVCSSDIDKSVDPGKCYATVIVPAPVASDNCGISSVINDFNGSADASGNYPTGITTLTWTATDLSGNTAICIQKITVTDDEDPVITCPGDRTEYLNSNCEFIVPDYTASIIVTDNCDPAPSVTQSPVSGTSLSGVGTAQAITIFATDNKGNTANCIFNIVLHDNTPPVISCSPDTIITAGEGIYEMELSLEVPVVNDNCGIQSVTNDFSSTADAGGIYPVGTTTVTYTATDQSGNTSQCSRQVIIRLGDDVPNGLVIPQGFSPNNDGLNDTFEIIGIGLYPENELHVYNVWGKEVFSMDGYDNSWDGKASTGVSSGEKLPTGTYYYILKLGNDRVVKGFVYLILE